MAKAPGRTAPNGTARSDWKCPLHVDHLLLGTDPVARQYSQITSGNGGRRTVKVRRPKNARIVDVSMRRGFTNNGLIEVGWDSEDEKGFAPSVPEEEFEDLQKGGVVYRLPARGIVLDFIHKVKSTRRADEATTSEQARLAEGPSPAELEAARTLSTFAVADGDVGLSREEIETALGVLSVSFHHLHSSRPNMSTNCRR